MARRMIGYVVAGTLAICLPSTAAPQEGQLSAAQTISFPTEDSGRVCADLYGQGTHAVVLAHGGRFNKESWREQAQALASQGFRILAIDFRGFGCSTGPHQEDFDSAPFENDVIAAVGYLKGHGAKSVSVVGGALVARLPAMHRLSRRRVKLIVSSFSARPRTSPQTS
jgi:pimeloyl-ACP methyl ester carboxylesterase